MKNSLVLLSVLFVIVAFNGQAAEQNAKKEQQRKKWAAQPQKQITKEQKQKALRKERDYKEKQNQPRLSL